MATKLIDRLAILVEVRRFRGMGGTESRSLRFNSYVRMQHFVRISTYVPFRRFWGDVRENLCNVFLLLFMALWVLTFAMRCRRAVLMLWPAFLFLGLKSMGFPPPLTIILLGGFHFFVRFLERFFFI
jgi:hypothetical protein